MIHNISRFIAALALLATSQGAWAAWTGTGNINDPYIISTREDLLLLAHRVNGTNGETAKTYQGMYFKLGADITFSHDPYELYGSPYDENYEAIGGYNGSTDRSFKGDFDGDGHTVSGIRIRKTTVSSIYQGLFGCIGSGANIHDVHLTDARIKGYNIVGGIAGYNNGGYIMRCSVTDSYITANENYYGTICGFTIYTGFLTNNYYHGCTVNGTAVTSGMGCQRADITANNGALPAYRLDLGDGVTIQTTMAADLGFSCDADNDGTAENYWRSGAVLTLGYTGTVPAGYLFDGLTATNGTVGGNANDGYTLTMPDQDAAITTAKTPDPAHFSVNDAGTEYTIHTATGWNVFCDLQEGGETFSGKTIVLAGDIGTPEDPVTRMGSSTTQFKGTFDGQGHTLTVQYGTPSEPVNQQFVAPFPNVTGGATFRRLTIAGSIYSGYDTNGDKGTGGLIGHLFGGVTVEHCVSTVTVNAVRDRAGGFVGLCEHAVTFTDCVSSAIVTCTGSGSGFVGWSRNGEHTIAFYGCLFDGKVLKQGTVGSGNGSFVGWKGFTKTVTITNCIAAPAADENMATDISATFCRYDADTNQDNGETHITNSYYTQALGDTQGKALHTVTAGTDVTVAHAGVATHYATSGITAYKATGASADSDPFIAGLLYNNILYAGSDDQLSLTLSNSATGAPLGYQYGYTASAGTLSGSTLTMPDADVTISVNTATLRSDGLEHEVSYIKADGTTQTAQAVALDGHEAVDGNGDINLAAGTYYVGTDITFANRIMPAGDITLILADGKTMTLNGNKQGIFNDSRNLTIYGQSLDDDAGTLRYDGKTDGIHADNYEQHSGNVRITTTGFGVCGIFASDVTLRGGTLTISADGYFARAIKGYTLSILGGHLTATATGTDASCIYASANDGTAITLGWTRPADRITASSISTEGGTVAVKDGQALADGSGHIYTGTLSADDLAALAGKTLQPCLVLNETDGVTPLTAFAGQANVPVIFTRPFTSAVASTVCLPFAISADQATAAGKFYTFAGVDTSDSEWVVTMQEDDPSNLASGELAANTPYLFMPSASREVTFSGTIANVADTYTAGTTDSDGWTYQGTYATLEWESDPRNIYGFASGQAYGNSGDKTAAGKFIRVHTGGIRPFRAYLQYSGSGQARALSRSANDGLPETMTVRLIGSNGQTTAIGTLDTRTGELDLDADSWYDMNGRRLSGKPSQKGVYINNNKKVIVK